MSAYGISKPKECGPVNGNRNSIKITKADIDEDPEGRGVVVEGYIDPASFEFLKVDKYQREQLSETKINSLMNALRTSRVPTVELGMRGDNIVTRGDVYHLQDEVYIVDGYQRISAGILVQEVEPICVPRIRAVIHLNTDFDWERHRFWDLNVGQTGLSGNVTLRNMQWDNKAVLALVRLANQKEFVLKDRICWDQAMKRDQFLSAITYARTVAMLHSHIGPGRYTSGAETAVGLEKIMANAGQRQFILNTKAFFDLVDKCFGIQHIFFKKTANHLKQTFLLALARMLSDHTNYWKDSALVIDAHTAKRLSTFPMTDPTVITLVSSNGGKSSEQLSLLLADHINRGRRKEHRLTRRAYIDDYEIESDDESSED